MGDARCCRYELDQRAAGFQRIKEMLLWLLGDVLEVKLSTSGGSHAGEVVDEGQSFERQWSTSLGHLALHAHKDYSIPSNAQSCYHGTSVCAHPSFSTTSGTCRLCHVCMHLMFASVAVVFEVDW